MTHTLTCLSGTLIRQSDGSWRWSDGQPESRIRDLSPDEWNFRCRTYGNGQCFVEVLRRVAQQSEALAWVIAGARAGKYGSGLSGDHAESRDPIPSVILVPIADHHIGKEFD